LLGIESDHDLLADNDGGSGAAAIRVNQFRDGLLVDADVFNFK
jgi:hypothetical protein